LTFVPAFATLDLGQGLAYHRAVALPPSPPATPARQPLVLDLRYATGDAGAGTAVAAWIKFHAAPRTPVFVLANAETSPALRAAFADRDHAAGLIVLGVPSADFTPDLVLEADPATERRAYEALIDAASLPALIAPPIDKPRNDEARLTAEWHPIVTEDGKPAIPPDHGKRAAAKSTGAAPTPPRPLRRRDPPTCRCAPPLSARLEETLVRARRIAFLRKPCPLCSSHHFTMPAPGYILAVCTANVCRSPMAAALLKHALAAQPEPLRSLEIISAGVGGRDGDVVSANSVTALKKVGLDISSHRSRAINEELVAAPSLSLA